MTTAGSADIVAEEQFNLKKWQKLLSFTYLSLLGLWLCGYVFLLLKIAFAQHLFFYSQDKELHYSDYVLWYVAGQIPLSDQRQHLYDPAVLVDFWNRLSSPARMDTAPVFQYPPFFALLFSPFALLPIELSYVIWTISSLAAGLAGLLAAVKQCNLLPTNRLPVFLLACATSYPSWISLRSGQLVWFYLFLFSGFYLTFLRRKEILAGLLLAILSTKPQYLIFMLIPAAIDRRWKIIASFAIFEFILLLASSLSFGLQNVIGYPSILFHQETSSRLIGVHPDEMVSVRLIFSLLLPQMIALPVSVLFMLSAVVLLCFFWVKILKTRRDLINWAMALTVTTSVVASAHSHAYDSLLLTLAAALTLKTTNLFEAATLYPKSLRIWHCAFIIYPLLGCGLFLLHEYHPITLVQSLSMITMNITILCCGFMQIKHLLSATPNQPQ